MRNPELWHPEYSSRNPESYLRLESRKNHSLLLEFRIQVTLTKTGILVRRIRNPRLGIQIPKLSWIALLGTKENQWAGVDRERL